MGVFAFCDSLIISLKLLSLNLDNFVLISLMLNNLNFVVRGATKQYGVRRSSLGCDAARTGCDAAVRGATKQYGVRRSTYGVR
jgi:hypothetical protein